MKIKLEMDEDDIRNAIGEYVKKRHPEVKQTSVHIEIHEADPDPRSPRSAHVGIIVTCT